MAAVTAVQFDLIAARARYDELVKRVVVLSHGSLPTTDIYLAPRLAALPGLKPHYVNTKSDNPAFDGFKDGDFVIIVRHAPLGWLKTLATCGRRLAGCVLLLDDDIPGVLGSPELPLLYALKTAWRYAISRKLLARICHAVWVSTPYLQGKYAYAYPRLLGPLYLGSSVLPRPQKTLTYFYHGTASHRRELAFLANVVRQVQGRLDNVHFEVMGGARTRRLFQGVPRVHVLPPMSWPDFLAYTSGVHHAVGLAPMQDSHFNRARSHNKLYDITRCGAAGIYSNVEIYRGRVQDGINGILCADNERDWVEAICDLLTQEEKRSWIFRNALYGCEQHAMDPEFRLQD